MNISDMQNKIKEIYAARGFTDDLMTLPLGLCEEAGEIAKAVNLLNPKYIRAKQGAPDSLEHEVADLLVYLVAICNSANIDLDVLMDGKIQKQISKLDNTCAPSQQ